MDLLLRHSHFVMFYVSLYVLFTGGCLLTVTRRGFPRLVSQRRRKRSKEQRARTYLSRIIFISRQHLLIGSASWVLELQCVCFYIEGVHFRAMDIYEDIAEFRMRGEEAKC